VRRLGLLLGVVLAACGSSGAGGGADGASGAGSGGSGGAPPVPTCAAYCAAIQAACTISNQQYGDLVTCMTACPAFPVGAGADMAGDTLGCRVHYTTMASASATAAGAWCTKAGPGGDGTCGENCGGYCDLVMMYCTDANAAKIYDDRAGCMADCAAHVTDAKYTSGNPGRTDMGNEVACQLYHAVEASQAPGEHCLGDLALTAFTCRP
jgi:hypothetical protein